MPTSTARSIINGRTLGVSPKVYVPALAQVAAGVVLVLIGEATAGEALIAAGLATVGLGGAAKPGTVQERRPS